MFEMYMLKRLKQIKKLRFISLYLEFVLCFIVYYFNILFTFKVTQITFLSLFLAIILQQK